MRTPITYYGGKASMLSVILPLIPEHKVYTEAFFGGGSVFFAKKPARNETINDRLNIVVNFYEQIKSNYKELKSRIDSTLFSRYHYNLAREIMTKNTEATKVDLAWAFWFRSNFSHSCKLDGGFKYCNEQSVVPPDVMNRKKLEFTELLMKRLEHTVIENRDALWVLESRNVPKAFHYIDPPYPGADQGHYKGYSFHDLEQLLDWMETCKGKFLFSNYDSPLLQEYINRNGWSFSSHTYRNKGMRFNDKTKNEILVWNYTLPQMTIFNQ